MLTPEYQQAPASFFVTNEDLDAIVFAMKDITTRGEALALLSRVMLIEVIRFTNNCKQMQRTLECHPPTMPS